jgi:HK97 family phage major capsid protein
MRARLDTLLEERNALHDEQRALFTAADAEKRGLNPTEQTKYDELATRKKAKDEELGECRERIVELEDEEARDKAAAAVRKTQVGAVREAEPTVYRQNGRESYWRDLFHARQNHDRDAIDRLARNNKIRQVDAEERALNTTPGTGGDFAPPLWMIDKFVALARPGRPLADLVNTMPLPSGVSSINMPRVASGSSTALQSTQNTAVSNTDPTTSAVTAPVQTIAGFVVISQQDIDQTPINFDDVILQDLAASYSAGIDAAVITALVAASTNIVTYTDASPTTAKVNQEVGQAIAQVHATRFMPPEVIVMTPQRWGHFNTYTDGNGRPLVVPNPLYNPMNAFGSVETPVASQGVAGTLQGVPVVVDPNIPGNLGGGNNQDEILVLRASDSYLFESEPVAEAMPQTYGNQLSVLCRFYRYYAFTAQRYPKGIAVISGTGMIPPAYGS